MDQTTRVLLGSKTTKPISSKVFVDVAGAQHVEGRNQDGVADSLGCFRGSDSMPTRLTPSATSQSRSASNSTVVAPKVRVVCWRWRAAPGVRTHATTWRGIRGWHQVVPRGWRDATDQPRPLVRPLPDAH